MVTGYLPNGTIQRYDLPKLRPEQGLTVVKVGAQQG
jgi:hypothetical protein